MSHNRNASESSKLRLYHQVNKSLLFGKMGLTDKIEIDLERSKEMILKNLSIVGAQKYTKMIKFICKNLKATFESVSKIRGFTNTLIYIKF